MPGGSIWRHIWPSHGSCLEALSLEVDSVLEAIDPVLPGRSRSKTPTMARAPSTSSEGMTGPSKPFQTHLKHLLRRHLEPYAALGSAKLFRSTNVRTMSCSCGLQTSNLPFQGRCDVGQEAVLFIEFCRTMHCTAKSSANSFQLNFAAPDLELTDFGLCM